MDGPDNQAIILEPDPSGIKVWNQGQGASGILDSNWSWNQIWGHATPGSDLTADGQWHLWEIYVKHDTGSNNGIETVWIDNVQRLHFTGLDINTGGTDSIKIHTNQAGVEGGACVPIYFDDIAVSTTGRIGPLVTTYTVTPSAGANGSISPNTAQIINSGSTTQFTVTPNSGYSASVGGTCGGSLVGTTYTTNAITADCTVSATFTEIAPALSSLLPTSNYAKTITTATLQVTTDKTATCRYALGSGIPYASMTQFTNTASTSHSSNVTVVAGGIYQYCFRCQATSAISDESCTRFAVDPNPKKRVLH